MSAARALKTADGHSAEAETAANEAAREARAEIIEQAEAPKRADASAKKELTGHGSCGQGRHAGGQGRSLAPLHRRRMADQFQLGGVRLYKRSRNKAKSRQFTTDMDVFAEVSRTVSAPACSATARMSGKARPAWTSAWSSSCSPIV